MIELHNVTKAFAPDVVALRDVTLTVDQGELVLITGPSGAGKSTLLRIIFAAERPESGKVLVAGRNVGRLRRSAIPYLRRNIGVVFQDFKLLRDRSALENVAIALEIRGLPRKVVQQRSLEALAAVGLDGRARVGISALSGGEQQRIAIARALVGRPAILLADEPTGNLDPERSHDILDLLDGVTRGGTTVLLATHDPMVVQNAAATRLVQLEAGRIASIALGMRALVAPPRVEQSDSPVSVPLPTAGLPAGAVS